MGLDGTHAGDCGWHVSYKAASPKPAGDTYSHMCNFEQIYA